MPKDLKEFLKKNGFKLISCKQYAEKEKISLRTVYQRIELKTVDYIKIDNGYVIIYKKKDE